MSLWTSITGVVKPLLGAAATAVGSFFGGPAGGMIGANVGGMLAGGGAPPTTAGAQAGGILSTPMAQPGAGIMGGGLNRGAPVSSNLPALYRGGGLTTVTGAPSPGAPGGFLQGLVQGATRTLTRGGGTKIGKLTGNTIPRGFVEKMSQAGVIYLAKHRRRRGITARDISSFYRVHRLVSKIRTPTHHRRSK